MSDDYSDDYYDDDFEEESPMKNPPPKKEEKEEAPASPEAIGSHSSLNSPTTTENPDSPPSWLRPIAKPKEEKRLNDESEPPPQHTPLGKAPEEKKKSPEPAPVSARSRSSSRNSYDSRRSDSRRSSYDSRRSSYDSRRSSRRSSYDSYDSRRSSPERAKTPPTPPVKQTPRQKPASAPGGSKPPMSARSIETASDGAYSDADEPAVTGGVRSWAVEQEPPKGSDPTTMVKEIALLRLKNAELQRAVDAVREQLAKIAPKLSSNVKKKQSVESERMNRLQIESNQLQAEHKALQRKLRDVEHVKDLEKQLSKREKEVKALRERNKFLQVEIRSNGKKLKHASTIEDQRAQMIEELRTEKKVAQKTLEKAQRDAELAEISKEAVLKRIAVLESKDKLPELRMEDVKRIVELKENLASKEEQIDALQYRLSVLKKAHESTARHQMLATGEEQEVDALRAEIAALRLKLGEKPKEKPTAAATAAPPPGRIRPVKKSSEKPPVHSNTNSRARSSTPKDSTSKKSASRSRASSTKSSRATTPKEPSPQATPTPAPSPAPTSDKKAEDEEKAAEQRRKENQRELDIVANNEKGERERVVEDEGVNFSAMLGRERQARELVQQREADQKKREAELEAERRRKAEEEEARRAEEEAAKKKENDAPSWMDSPSPTKEERNESPPPPAPAPAAAGRRSTPMEGSSNGAERRPSWMEKEDNNSRTTAPTSRRNSNPPTPPPAAPVEEKKEEPPADDDGPAWLMDD